jgi:hypothetical protein
MSAPGDPPGRGLSSRPSGVLSRILENEFHRVRYVEHTFNAQAGNGADPSPWPRLGPASWRVPARPENSALVNLFALAIRSGLRAKDLRNVVSAYLSAGSDLGELVRAEGAPCPGPQAFVLDLFRRFGTAASGCLPLPRADMLSYVALQTP